MNNYMRLAQSSSDRDALLSEDDHSPRDFTQEWIPYKIRILKRKGYLLLAFLAIILLGGWLVYRHTATTTKQTKLEDTTTIIITTTIKEATSEDMSNQEANKGKPEHKSAAEDKGKFDRKFEIRFKNKHLPIQMNFSRPCAPETKLLILTLSSRKGFEERRGIRQTWIKDALPHQSHRFLIADRSPDGGEPPAVQQQLDTEQSQHGDLVLLHGMADVYLNLNIKLYGGFLWQQAYCEQAEWVLKADDDMVVHLGRLDYWIEHKFAGIARDHNGLAYFGLMMRTRPNRDNNSIWYIPKDWWPEDTYPYFMGGHTRLTTSKAVGAILAQSDQAYLIQPEDVLYSGILADRANVTKSDQKQHFPMGTDGSKCEDGVPTGVTAHVGSTSKHEKKVQEYEQFYGQLKALQCPSDVANKKNDAKNRKK